MTLRNTHFLIPFLAFLGGILLSLTNTDISAFDILMALLLMCLVPVLVQTELPTTDAKDHALTAFGFLAVLLILSFLFLPLNDILFALTTAYVLVLFVIGRILRAYTWSHLFLTGYRVGAFLVSLIGILVWYLGPDTGIGVTFIQGDRLMMLFSDPNVFGAFLVPALLYEIAYGIEHKEDRVRVSGSIVASLIILLALNLSGSRGAYLSGAIGLITFILLHHTRGIMRMQSFLLPILFGITIIGIILGVTSRGELLELRYSASILPRIETYSWSLHTIADRDIPTLLRGTGSGSFEMLAPRGISAHNTYLRILFEQGLLGLGTFLIGIFAVLHTFWKTSLKKSTTIALFASIIGILAHGFVIDTLHMRHFWILLGLL